MSKTVGVAYAIYFNCDEIDENVVLSLIPML